MPDSERLLTLARNLAGDYDNQTQALDQPIWFVHLRLWYRPLPIRIHGHLALFAEQTNALLLDQSYRQRVAVLREDAEQGLQVQYWAFRAPERFRGAGLHGDRLLSLTLDDLEALPGCVLQVDERDGMFRGVMAAGDRCCFQYQGELRQVVLGLEVGGDRLLSYDRGVDPVTGKSLWGAMMGPYEFHKRQDLSGELPL
jgi:hypothetical protein